MMLKHGQCQCNLTSINTISYLTVSAFLVHIHIMIGNITKKELSACATCACFNIRKASRTVTQYYDEIMSGAGLRGTQFSILVVVSILGELTISVLAGKLVMDRTTLTRNLKPLEKQGLIQIGPGQDRRTRAIQITESGQQILTVALPLWQEAQTKLIDKMGQQRFDYLIGELNEIEKIAAKS